MATTTGVDHQATGSRKWAGYAAVVGGLVNIVIAFTGPTANENEGTIIFLTGVFAQGIATALMLYGLSGLHRRYGAQYGRVGRVLAGVFGLALGWLTLASLVSGAAFLFDVFDAFSAVEESWWFVNLVTMLVASLYGVVLWRNDVLGAGGIALAATAPLAIAIVVVLNATVGNIGLAFWVPLGVAWSVAGYTMLRDRDATRH